MERQPCSRVPLAFLPCHHSLIFTCGFYNGFQYLENKCIVMCSLTHSILRNSSVHFRVFVNFPSFLLLIVYNLMRNAGEKISVISVLFGVLILHGIVAVDLYASWWKMSSCLPECSRRVKSVLLAKLLRDTPWSIPFISSLFNGIVKSPITYC